MLLHSQKIIMIVVFHNITVTAAKTFIFYFYFGGSVGYHGNSFTGFVISFVQLTGGGTSNENSSEATRKLCSVSLSFKRYI